MIENFCLELDASSPDDTMNHWLQNKVHAMIWYRANVTLFVKFTQRVQVKEELDFHGMLSYAWHTACTKLTLNNHLLYIDAS